MRKKNLVSSGTQAVPVNIHSDDVKLTESTYSTGKFWGKQQHTRASHSEKGVQECGATDAAVMKSEGGNLLSEHVELDDKKKRRKKKDHRDISRSPRLLGSNTKPLSRSSSSVSSSGTKPDEDDEKIDLHSWTDFPPVSSRIAAPSASSKQLLKSSLSPDERVPLTVERSAHEPPWSIRFSSADQLRSERRRSSSGDKDKYASPTISSPPESAWGSIGRSFRSSQTVGVGQDLTCIMPSAEKVPLLNSGGKPDCSVASDTSRNLNTEAISRCPAQSSKSTAVVNRTDHKNEPVTTAKVSYSHMASGNVIKKHVEQGKNNMNILKCLSSINSKYTSPAPNIIFNRFIVSQTSNGCKNSSVKHYLEAETL